MNGKHGKGDTTVDRLNVANSATTTGAVKAPSGRRRIRNIAVMVIVGLLAGALSGLFGIGGGSIIVPALVWIGYTQRHAAATSLAAIIPLSISGVGSYAANGNVDWLAAALMVVGTIAGSIMGSWLLSRLSELLLRWAYVAFLAFVMISQVILVPSRDSVIHMTAIKGTCLIVLGILIGMLSALLGVGGGAVAVPALSLAFGASDLIARGTSLLAMFPSAITGTISNWKRGLVNLGTGLLIGIAAAAATPIGSAVASMLSARAGSYLLAAYLLIVLLRCTWTALKITPSIGPMLPRR
ncbi:sulfite exporter TauE/SafE family protein [Bifidobacterium bombi]|uniref:Probable membrane transporter protein n=1 Tax=Bifidobacterium bombi DSM 19703 TaxID=1341695 RepID=A0A086BPF5_9BIFI|nr:sulfite exporter TauE/SafE family protein [Bifidobacterium bombi]KFF31819.1 sulfite exporter TauE/SafE domain protein [Bifidobacterium bombi DSM 19703]